MEVGTKDIQHPRAHGIASFVIACTTAAVVSCVTDPLTARPVSTPEWTVKNVVGYGETVAGLPPDTAYGWDLRVAGGVARWRECKSPEECSDLERQRPASELLGYSPIGTVDIGDGGAIDVLRLSLAARPKYVVPKVR